MRGYSKLFFVALTFGLIALGITSALGGNPMIWVPLTVGVYMLLAAGVN